MLLGVDRFGCSLRRQGPLFAHLRRLSDVSVLAEIAQLDPMEVSFRVPYVERQRALDKAGTSNADADEVFDKSSLSLELPSERMYELPGKPEPHGEEIDQSTDVMTVWAVFPNPHNVLVPGLKVEVISHLADQPR
jgi:membrane fusion protein (multidrug efflux system)